MTSSLVQPPMTLQLDPVIEIDDGQLFELCRRNRELRIERSASGDLTLMSPAGGKTSDRNAEIVAQLRNWARRDATGRPFDSSAGFTLPNGAMRSPDAAWVERRRLSALTREQQDRFLPLCPTFLVELRSPSDPLAKLQAKMVEYLENGACLGWLIDPEERRFFVYRPNLDPEVLKNPASVSADPELPGFVLELAEVWDPIW